MISKIVPAATNPTITNTKACNAIDGIVSESNEKGFVVIIIF